MARPGCRPGPASSFQAVVAAVLTMILNPPALPRPSTGGRRKRRPGRSIISRKAARRSPAIARAVPSGAVAIGERVEDHEQRAEVRSVGVEEERLPGDAQVWPTPAHVGRSFHLPHDGLRPLQRGRVGQLRVDEQVTLVLGGHETGGQVMKPDTSARAGRRKSAGHDRAADAKPHDRA